MAEAVAAALWEVGAAWATDAAIWVASNAAAINAVATIAASQTYSGYKQRQAQRAARAGYLASLKDRELMIRSGVAPRRWIYGTDRVSGPIVYAQSTGAKQQYLHLVIALAAHQCDAIETVYFGDVALPDPDGSGFITSGPFGGTATVDTTETVGVSGTFTATLSGNAKRIIYISQDGVLPSGGPAMVSGWSHTPGSNTITGIGTTGLINVQYDKIISAPKVRIKRYLGAPGQTADADLVAESGGKWTTAHKGTGICYLYVRLEWDSDLFGATGLPEIRAVVRGYKLSDPRTGTTAYSDNAALVCAHWLKNADGLQATSTEVPDSEVTAAANISDESIALNLAGDTQKRYTFNGSFTSDQSPRDVLEDILQSMAGSAVWCQGRWLVRPGAYRTPGAAITPDSIAGPGIQIVRKPGRDQLFNAVRATYRDPAQAWAEVQAPLVTNSTYEAQDGGVRKVRSIQLASAMDAMRAQRLAKITLEEHRQATTVRLSTNLSAYNLAPTDTVPLQLPRYGWSGKVFEVKERTFSPTGTIDYNLRETAAGVWAWNYGEATTVDLAPDTDLPNPYTPPAALTGLAVASGTTHLLRQTDGTVLARARLTWTQTTDAFVLSGGTVQIQWRKVSGTQWQVEPDVPGDSTSAYVAPVPDGEQVLFRIRAVNSLGRPSEWTNIVHLVLGKTENPSDVTGLTSSVAGGVIPWRWDPCPDADYEATEVRSSDANWGSTTVLPLWRGRVSEYQENVSATGTYTRYFRHFDDGRRSSTTTATRSQVVTTGDLGTGGGGAAAAALVLTPASATLTANVDGAVTNFGPAHSVATMVLPDGSDVTSAWTYSKVDSGVASTLSGSLGNILQVTGYDPNSVASYWRRVALQLHFDNNVGDSSIYGRVPNWIGTGITFSSSSPAMGSHSANFPGGNWGTNAIRYGPDPSLRVAGFFSMRCRVKVSAYAPGGVGFEYAFLGNDYRRFRAINISGGIDFSFLWLASGGTINLSTSGIISCSLNTWYALEATYCPDGFVRLFVNGALIATSSTAITTLTDDASLAETQYFCLGKATAQSDPFETRALNGLLDEVQFIQGPGGHTAAYTVETYPLPDGAYVPAAYVDVTATQGALTVTERFNITTIQPAPRTVTSYLSKTPIVLAGNEDGVVTSFTGATSAAVILLDGADDSPNWVAAPAIQYSNVGIAATISGRTITITAWPTALNDGTITTTWLRSGYPTQQLVLPVNKTTAARRAQTQQLDKTVLLIAGEVGGKVPSASYTGATVAMTVALGGVDDTANWSFTRSASSGLTTTISGNVVTLTNISDSVDAGTIDITATRAGWTTTTLRCTVTKTRLLPNSGVTPPPNELLVWASGTAGSATAQIQLLADGTIQEVVNGGTPNTLANWYSPTTSSIGSSYWVRADLIAGIAVSSGTTGTWQQLSSTRSWSRATVSSGGGLVTGSRLRIRIATDSAGATVVGTVQALLQTLNE